MLRKKMTNTLKLKAKIMENGHTITSLAKKISLSKPALSQKINNKIKFSQNDIKNIVNELNLTGDDVKEIFLN